MSEGGQDEREVVQEVVEATDCFMARWHRHDTWRNWLRHAAEDAKSGDEGRGGRSRTDTVVDECRNEMIDRVARYQFD